ncbi:MULTISPECIES: sensor domain-containing diguanylate cyclase [Psychrilyobacter]|uniref:Diguanylate cyclase n=1 Tax=Psychrilyobacter piezotolerans TaxID=2293438 RepID=A0ABX9KG96_9FUSO|nr:MULTISPECIES: GGDEF domain-containing protein [Psychrilyobacter]MCS5422912.1 GGDEF domain-containing protein [Psychrilyobacter sp. S5]NDI78428.1 sensor domain-containing diguanylate cyclase [Psychrilyobacter piezotolerans]RDE61152.1 GGDEF domain-containing protein [Psychrilyobacter sp. S5]REI40793.1 diguanylate cyclase [Psychrilyobacter piezotolerans]
MSDFEKYNSQYEEPKSTMFQMLDKNGDILHVNQKWLEEMGYELHEVKGRFFGEFITEDYHVAVKKNFPHLKDYGFVNNVQLKLKRKDGVVIETVLNGISVYDEEGNFINTRCEMRNLNYFMESSIYIQALLEKERFLKGNLFFKSQITQAILYSDTLNEFLNSVTKIFKEPVEVMGIYLSSLDVFGKRTILFDYKSESQFSETMKNSLSCKNCMSEIKDKTFIIDSNSKSNIFEGINSQLGINESLVILPVVSSKKILVNKIDFFIHLKDLTPFEEEWLFFLKDIKDILSLGIETFETDENLKNTMNKLYHLSTKDPLTGVYNRYEFEKSVKENIRIFERYNTHFSLIMYDIDNFKSINDTFGHCIGDKVLKELCRLVTKNIRGIDKLFRLGGDEFVILLPESDQKDAFKLAERLKDEVSSFDFSGDNLTCSFGVTEVRRGDVIDKIMKRSDNAMYTSKKNNKNRVSIG